MVVAISNVCAALELLRKWRSLSVSARLPRKQRRLRRSWSAARNNDDWTKQNAKGKLLRRRRCRGRGGVRNNGDWTKQNANGKQLSKRKCNGKTLGIHHNQRKRNGENG